MPVHPFILFELVCIKPHARIRLPNNIKIEFLNVKLNIKLYKLAYNQRTVKKQSAEIRLTIN